MNAVVEPVAPTVNLADASRFLDFMAEGEAVTFQTFDDDADRKQPELANILHGDIGECAPKLQRLNACGAGVYWMVNFGDGLGRSEPNVTSVRAVFLDLDGAPLQPVLAAGVEPHSVVESSPGKWHVYWQVNGCRLDHFKPVQQALAAKFGGDTSVNDLPRVLRVPGFIHAKRDHKKGLTGEPFRSRIESLEAFQPYDLAELVQRLGLDLTPKKKERIDPETGEIHDDKPGKHVFAEAVQRLGRNLRSGDGRRAMLKTYIASRSGRGLKADDIKLLIAGIAAGYFDPDDPFDEANISEIVEYFVGLDAADNATAAQRREQQRKKAQDIGDGTDGQAPLIDIMGLDEMIKGVVFISDGSRVAYRDRPQTALPLNEFKLHTRASDTRVGTKHVPTADLWVQDPQRITTHTLTYRPGHPEFTADPEGSPALNLWRDRPRVASSGSVAPFLQHVAYLVPDEAERERFLSWLAHIEQHPGVLPHTHYLMVTPQTGIGRNWLASLLARVWAGATRLGFDLMGAMHSGFNGALSRRLLVIVDELKAADTHYGAGNHAEALKAMLTTEHRGINPKFGRQHIEFNCARWLMLSQHYDALPLARSDRRVIVISNPTTRKPADYYARLYAMLDDAEFVGAVAGWLAARDLTGFNPSEPAPLTEAKAKAIEANISDLERALIELRDGTDSLVMTNLQINEYMQDCGIKVPAGRAMSVAYAATGLVPCDRLVTIRGKKHRVVALRDGERIKTADTNTLMDLLGSKA